MSQRRYGISWGRSVVEEGSRRTNRWTLQWISEVSHFCPGTPIILVGMKKELRHDPKTIEELRKTGQRPVTPEEVSQGTLGLPFQLAFAID